MDTLFGHGLSGAQVSARTQSHRLSLGQADGWPASPALVLAFRQTCSCAAQNFDSEMFLGANAVVAAVVSSALLLKLVKV